MTNSLRTRYASASAVALALALVLGACGSSTRSRAAGAPPVRESPAVTAPTATTKMICAPEAVRDIAAAIGEGTVRPVVGTWMPPHYSCQYTYRQGSFTLSVQQLPDQMSTERYFTAITTTLGRGTILTGLGQAATTTTAGSVVVRKDNKVLTVDPRSLPARFGTPPDTRANVAITIAATIMGCWSGS